MWIWLLQMIHGTLDHCLITTLYLQCILQIYFGMILCETRHHAQTYFTLCTLEHSVCWCGFPASQHLLKPHSAFQPSWGWGDLEAVWNPGGYILHHTKITEFNCWVLLDPEGGKTILWSTWGYVDSSNSCWTYNQNCRRTPRASLCRSTMWGFTGWWLSQKFPSAVGEFILISMYTSCLPFQTNAVKPLLIFTLMSVLFNFSFFSPKSGGMSFLFGHTLPYQFIFLVSKSSKSLGNEKTSPWIVCVLGLQLFASNV